MPEDIKTRPQPEEVKVILPTRRAEFAPHERKRAVRAEPVRVKNRTSGKAKKHKPLINVRRPGLIPKTEGDSDTKE